MVKRLNVVYVEDDNYFSKLTAMLLKTKGISNNPEYDKYEINLSIFSLISDFEKHTNTHPFDLLLLDIVHPPNSEDDIKTDSFGFVDDKWHAFSLVKRIKNRLPESIIFVYSNYDDQKTRNRFLSAGIDHFISKSCLELKQEIIDNYQIVKKTRASIKAKVVINNKYYGETMAKISLQVIYIVNRKLIKNTIITGDAGVGKKIVLSFFEKELVKKDFSYKRYNCAAALSELTLIHNDPVDVLLLEEISLLPKDIQKNLAKTKKVKNIVATSIIDLNALVKAGIFDNALFQRLRDNELYIPPLRKRAEEIGIIANGIVKYKLANSPFIISSQVIEVLEGFSWNNNNIKELYNVLLIMAQYSENENTKEIQPYMIPPNIVQLSHKKKIKSPSSKSKVNVSFKISKVEYKDIEDLVLLKCIEESVARFDAKNITQVSKIIRLPRATLVFRINKMSKHHQNKIQKLLRKYS